MRLFNSMGLYVGRFSGLTIAHKQLIDVMQNTHLACKILLVKGQKTSQDKNKNPFPIELQLEMLSLVTQPGTTVEVVTDNLFETLVTLILTSTHSNFALYTGPDRIKEFKKLHKYINNESKHLKIIDTEYMLPRCPAISGTKFREAVRTNDLNIFRQVAPLELWPLFDTLRNFF